MNGWLRRWLRSRPGQPRQGWLAGVTGLLVSAVLAVGGALLVDWMTGELSSKDSSSWAIGVLIFLVIAAGVWRLYQMLPPVPGPEDSSDEPGAGQRGDEEEDLLHGLPPDVSGFVGRSEQLDQIVEHAQREPALAAVGQRGVGTSAFALHAAHVLQPGYDDGQVYVDVRGSERRPLKPEQVLGRVCLALGLPAPRSRRPSDLDAAADRLRSWLALRRVLIVLDNVDDPEQVRRLLPNSPRSLALLAGSGDLKQLGAIHCVDIEVPTTDEAVLLLEQAACRDLVDADEQAARELVRLFGRQPLAIRLLGQQLLKHGWTVDELRREIAAVTAQPRYEQEPEGSTALREVWDTCDVAYQRLASGAQRMFRLLGLVPATEIGGYAAAALAGVSPDRAEQALADLAGVGLLESVTGGRYRLRKLLAASARLHLSLSESAAQQQRALIRFARHLATAATEQSRVLLPDGRPRAETHRAARAQARRWFAREQDLLRRLVTNWHATDDAGTGVEAAQEQPPEPVQPWLFRAAVALCVWYAQEQRLTEWQDVCLAVLAMRLADTDPEVASWARKELGVVYRQQGDPVAACDELTRAVRPTTPARRAAQVEANLGLAWLDRLVWVDPGGLGTAITHFGNARRLRGDRYGRAIDDLGLSAVCLHRRDLVAARHHIGACLDAFDELNEPRGLAAALNNLALALWLERNYTDAEDYWERALTHYAELDDRAGCAQVRLNLAVMLLDSDPSRMDEAVNLLQESLEWRVASPDNVGTGLCHLHLGDGYAQRGEAEKAKAEWTRAREIFHELGATTAYDEASRRLDQPPDL